MLREDWFILEVCVVTCRERLRSKFSGLLTLIDKMAPVNSRDILCLFDVDGTVTPARLVRFSDRSLFLLKKGCRLWRCTWNGFPSTYKKSDRKHNPSIFLGFIFCSGSHPRNEGIYEETSPEGRSRLGWRIRLSKTRRTNGRGQW